MEIDRTGTMRTPEEFLRARQIVVARIVKGVPTTPADIELFLEFTTIVQALEIAASVAETRRKI